MNFLFGAVLIILLLLPGVIFRTAFQAVSYKKADPQSNFIDKIFASLFTSLILQVPFYLLTNILVGVDEKKLYLLLINSDKVVLDSSISSLEIGLFFIYTVTICGLASVLGYFARKLVVYKKWDLRFSFLKVYSDWYIFFEGRILDLPGQPGDSSIVNQKWLDVLVETKECSYIYSGLLREYVLSGEDILDRIYLAGVMRRKLSNDSSMELSLESPMNKEEKKEHRDDRYYYMPGDFFMIPGDQIKNINITYWSANMNTSAEEIEPT